MKKPVYHLLLSIVSAVAIHSIFIMTFSQQGILMNRRLSETYYEMKRIETEITELLEQSHRIENIRELQQELAALHREAQQLMSSRPSGMQAHAAGLMLGTFGGITVMYLLTIRSRKGDKRRDRRKT